MIDVLSGAPHFLVGLMTGVVFTTLYYSYRRWCPALLRSGSVDAPAIEKTSYSVVTTHSGSADSADSNESDRSIEVEMLNMKIPSDDLDDVFKEGDSAFDDAGRFRVRDGVYKPYDNPFAKV